MGVIDKLFKKLKNDSTLKKDEHNKKEIKPIKPKITEPNKKYNLNESKSSNDLLEGISRYHYLKKDKDYINTRRRTKESDINNVIEKENEANIQKNMDSLLKSDNYTYVKDFMDRWGNDKYTKQSLRILHKKLDNKGFKIDENDLKPLLIQIRGLEEEKKINKITKNKKLHPLIKSDSYRIVKDFVKRFGDDNYPDVSFKDLNRRLGNLGFKIDENDLRYLLMRIRKLEAENQIKLYPLKDKDISLIFQSKKEMFIDKNGKFLNDNIPWLKNYLIVRKGYDQEHANFVIRIFKKELKKEYRTKEKLRKEYERHLSLKNDNYLTTNKIDSLNGIEFENLLKRLFQKMGYTVQSTKLSGDQGADLIITNHYGKIAIQAKRHKNKVGNRAVQEVSASIAHYCADKGMVVTNSQYTKSAIELAKSNQIQLIDGNELNSLINKYLK